MSLWGSGRGISNLTNYGKMGAIEYSGSETMILNNFGVITQRQSLNLKAASGKILIQNYALIISENAETFNKSTYSQSHILASGSVRFKDENSKIILDFRSGFEPDAEYKTANVASGLSVDFDRLTPKNDIYTLYKQGYYFIAKLAPEHSAIANINKANIRTMNNFYLMSNSMIYPRKLYHSQNLGRTHSLLQHSPSLAEGARGWVEYPSLRDSVFSLKVYESFAYQNESQNPQTRRIKRQNKRNYNRKSQNLNADSTNENNPSLRAKRSNHPQINKEQNYYFILTPFFNYNSFAQSGNYNLSGFDYGFLTAFSARVAESNSLGAHFMMSYGTLGDSKDKDLSIKSLNLNVGLNYKLDLIYDMYLKARGDFFYFSNVLDSATIKNIKPNNLGFGASVIFGKDFDFKSGGVLGIEVGLDYKALQSSTISLHDNTYNKSLYNLIYADLGLNYSKYFNTNAGIWGVNAALGVRGNITANKLAISKIHINNLNRNIDMVLDNDNFLGYANLGASYVLNAKNFDMEFSLAYYGNYGDRVISNGGGFEWRVVW